ncbi:MAG TPA: (2Fe-2S)-binding protein [Candidatus Baltobacteraceae bacterium]|nr:(2Fe-2S)-binding protein [Candidatus Baltobacteraceae bacterium]
MTLASPKVLRRFRINGAVIECAFHPNKTLLEVLREDLALTGTKHGCELGQCGACTVLLDGVPTLACLTLAVECEDREIETIEGLAKDGDLHALQRAFVDCGAAQCGYCTPGVILSGVALLEANAHPEVDDVKAALAGNLCRCTGYTKIVDAVMLAAERMRDDR